MKGSTSFSQGDSTWKSTSHSITCNNVKILLRRVWKELEFILSVIKLSQCVQLCAGLQVHSHVDLVLKKATDIVSLTSVILMWM